MDRICAALDCECSLDGCPHDHRRKAGQARFCSAACSSRTRQANFRKRRLKAEVADLLGIPAELLDVTESPLDVETDDPLFSAYERAIPSASEPVYTKSRFMPTRAEIDRALAAEYTRFRALAKPHLDRMNMLNTTIEPMPLRQLRAAHEARLADIEEGRI